MDHSNEKVFLRIAEALERISPPEKPLTDLKEGNSYIWKSHPDRLIPMHADSKISLNLLVGIEEVKKQLLKNTLQFSKGFPGNNVLLWGARGTGKSSLVKAVHQIVSKEFTDLKLVEIQRDDLRSLDRLLSILALVGQGHKYVIFCDDLSFVGEDNEYKILKTLLEGGIVEKPDNVLFYATSNRKHLIAREMVENEQSVGISSSEAIEEKVSLSDRFGLVLGFYPCSQKQYLEMVLLYRDAFNIPIGKEQLYEDAIEWQQARGARSGRVAWQYILNLAGRLEVSLDQSH